MSNKTDEEILRDDPDLASMFTDDDSDGDSDDVNDDNDYMEDFKGFNFARSGSQRQKKNG